VEQWGKRFAPMSGVMLNLDTTLVRPGCGQRRCAFEHLERWSSGHK